MLVHLQSALGIVAIVALAWALSENRRAFPWRTVVVGLGLQVGIALLLLKIPVARDVLFSLNGVVDSLAGYYIAPDLKEVVYFGIFLLILVLRPAGLFGVGTE